MKKQLGPSDAIFPVPAAMIVSGIKERANIITLAWIGIVSSTPPTIGISIRKQRYSLDLIREVGEFTVNIAQASLYKQVDYCGLVSGKNRNKFQEAGLTPVASSIVQPPLIEECPYNMECRVSQEITLGEYSLILGEILETHIDADKRDPEKRAGLDMARIDPLLYYAEAREYWRAGEKLGHGFQAGRLRNLPRPD